MPLTVKQFIRRLVEAELFPRDELVDFVNGLDPRLDDGEQLANALVRKRKLTKYQAQVAYAGDGKTRVLGNYVLLDRIGAGGMGEVFLAQRRRLGRKAALKILPAKVNDNADAVRRFHREVQAIAKRSHPNIVAAFDAGESNGTHYCVMEYVAGRDLAAIVKQEGPLDVRRAIDCIIQSAAGLEYAHQQRVIHRDIKPSNLLLVEGGGSRDGSVRQSICGSSKAIFFRQSMFVSGCCDRSIPTQRRLLYRIAHGFMRASSCGTKTERFSNSPALA